jgi:hypothetical protein
MGYHISSVSSLSSLPGFTTAMAIHRRIASSDDAGYRTPLFGDIDPFAVVANWNRRKMSPTFTDLESIEIKKVGPFFNRPFDEWSSNLGNYYTHAPQDWDDRWWERDVRFLEAVNEELFSLMKIIGTRCRPLSILDGYRMSRKGTNLGFPYVTSTWSEKVIGHYLRRASLLLEGKNPDLYPFIMFKRTQPGGPERKDSKQRPVWGADHAESFAAICVLQPLLSKLSRNEQFSHLLGIDSLESQLKRDLPRARFKFSLDLGQADATFGPKWQQLTLWMLGQLVDVDLQYLRSIYDYYSAGDLLTPDGIYKGIHGLPSGVGFTNMLEILGFRVMARYALKELRVSYFALYQNGDDGLYLLNDLCEPSDLSDIYQRFGLVLNVDKSGMSPDEASYLQRHFKEQHGYQAVMSTNRMLGRILYAERGVDAKKLGMSVKDYWTLNTIMKLENCKRHPDYRSLVDFVRAGDESGLNPRPILGKDPADVEGYSPFGEGVYGKSGLLEFETVKILLGDGRKKRGPQYADNRVRNINVSNQ